MLQLATGLLLTFGVSTSAAEPQATRQSEPSIRVECHGKLRYGVVAIGGETTGTTITFDGMTWELKLPDEAVTALNEVTKPQLNFPADFVRGAGMFRRGGTTVNGETVPPWPMAPKSDAERH